MSYPAKPASRPDRTGPVGRIRRFRRDVFSSQPDRLYGAWMAEMRTPFLRSFLVNDPEIVDVVFRDAEAFPKARVLRETLASLLGNSLFVSNGADWRRQRRMMDPIFQDAAALRAAEPVMRKSAAALVARIASAESGVDIEEETSRFAADVMFRLLLSRPIDEPEARQLFHAFRRYQRAQPLWQPAALLGLPNWLRRGPGREARQAAADILGPLRRIIAARRAEIGQNVAPEDMLTRMMLARDSESGGGFSDQELLDQLTILLLAGHETSASGLAWAFYLLARESGWQGRVSAEAKAARSLRDLRLARDVYREVLRLYPPVPFLLRDVARAQRWRGRAVPVASLAMISPWYLQRNRRLWVNPDAFDPGRWSDPEQRAACRGAYAPFGAGARVCIGAGLGMAEGVLALAAVCQAFELSLIEEPVPVAHLTLRSRDGIWLRFSPRRGIGTSSEQTA